MGMNYYARISKKQKDIINSNSCISDLAKYCVNKFNLHIGKSSWGWRFMFQVQEIFVKGESVVLDTFAKWKKFVNRDDIDVFNEDNEIVDKKWFINFIQEKQNEVHPNEYDNTCCHDFESSDGYRMCDIDFS